MVCCWFLYLVVNLNALLILLTTVPFPKSYTWRGLWLKEKNKSCSQSCASDFFRPVVWFLRHILLHWLSKACTSQAEWGWPYQDGHGDQEVSHRRWNCITSSFQIIIHLLTHMLLATDAQRETCWSYQNQAAGCLGIVSVWKKQQMFIALPIGSCSLCSGTLCSPRTPLVCKRDCRGDELLFGLGCFSVLYLLLWWGHTTYWESHMLKHTVVLSVRLTLEIFFPSPQAVLQQHRTTWCSGFAQASLRWWFYYAVHAEHGFFSGTGSVWSRLEGSSNIACFCWGESPQLIDYQVCETKRPPLRERENTAWPIEVTVTEQ